ncbi:MAG: S8 family serine peptidase [Candidatus Coatesbacteria bacterium]|nr:MAG: S8 family serine peptidase [Candidatus Coatesbacteria bacterium]
MKVQLLPLAVVFLIAYPSAFGSSPSDYMVEVGPGVYEVTDRILVVLERGVGVNRSDDAVFGIESLDALVADLNVIRVEQEFPNSGPEFDLDRHYIVHFDLAEATDALAARAVDEFATDPDVRTAERIRVHRVNLVPNDPRFTQQWALKPSEEFNIRAHRAWNITTGSTNVKLAIADTGVAYDHEDLAANIWHNPGESYNDADSDGNGYVDDVIGWDWVHNAWPHEEGEDWKDPDNDPMDYMGHGTHLSGIASAVTNNGKGVAGVNWNAKIMCLRVGWSAFPYGYVGMDFCAQAMYYAANEGADAYNASWGNSNSGGLGAATDYFINHDGVVVAAGGNDGGTSYSYLCGRNDVLAVAAINAIGKKASFSNYGHWVDCCAPGANIHSTYYRGPTHHYYYYSMDGTSMAAPFVTGLAGLVRAKFPGYSESQVRDAILDGCWDIDWNNPNYEGKLGEGLINCYNPLVNNNDVELKYFTAASTPEGVKLEWDAEEFETAGYNLYRRETAAGKARLGDNLDGYAKVNTDLITGTAPYVYLDGGLDEGSYEYILEDVDLNGKTTQHGPAYVDHNPSSPGAYALYACRPNPASENAVISFSVPESHTGAVELVVYDIAGRKTVDLSFGVVEPGSHEVAVDTSAMAPGVYVYRMAAGDFSAVKKMVIAR